MKEYVCVQVDHRNKIPELIQEYQKKGWRLHTYQATDWANYTMGTIITYCLKKEDDY